MNLIFRKIYIFLTPLADFLPVLNKLLLFFTKFIYLFLKSNFFICTLFLQCDASFCQNNVLSMYKNYNIFKTDLIYCINVKKQDRFAHIYQALILMA